MHKKIKSKQYPFYSLRRSIEFAKLIYDVGGNGPVPIESIVSHMGLKSSNNKRFAYEKSSARQFGLIKKVDNCLQITTEARIILFPSEPDDSNQILKLNEALVNPKLYRELINRYNNKILPKKEFLRNIFRQKGIIESSLEAAVNAFLKSVSYVGVISSDNKIKIDDLIFNQIKTKEEKGRIDQLIKEERRLKITDDVKKYKTAFINYNTTISELKQERDYYSLELPISSGKKAVILIPKESTKEDLNILKSFINVIENNI